MKSFIFILIVSLQVFAAPFDEAELRDLQKTRKALLAKIENPFTESWKRTQSALSVSEVYAREMDYQLEMNKLSSKHDIADNKEDLEKLTRKLLRTPDPLASLIAYEHLLQWMDKTDKVFFDKDLKRHAVEIVVSGKHYPIERTLLFEKSFRFATDPTYGLGLKGNAALKFSIENASKSNAWAEISRQATEKYTAILENERKIREAKAEAEAIAQRERAKLEEIARLEKLKRKQDFDARVAELAKTLPDTKNANELKEWMKKEAAFVGLDVPHLAKFNHLNNEDRKKAVAQQILASDLVRSEDPKIPLPDRNLKAMRLAATDLEHLHEMFATGKIEIDEPKIIPTPPPTPTPPPQPMHPGMKKLIGAAAVGTAVAGVGILMTPPKVPCIRIPEEIVRVEEKPLDPEAEIKDPFAEDFEDLP